MHNVSQCDCTTQKRTPQTQNLKKIIIIKICRSEVKSERESVGRGVQCTIILIECGPHTQMHGCAKSSNLFLFFFFKVFFFLGPSGKQIKAGR